MSRPMAYHRIDSNNWHTGNPRQETRDLDELVWFFFHDKLFLWELNHPTRATFIQSKNRNHSNLISPSILYTSTAHQRPSINLKTLENTLKLYPNHNYIIISVIRGRMTQCIPWTDVTPQTHYQGNIIGYLVSKTRLWTLREIKWREGTWERYEFLYIFQTWSISWR